MNKGWKVYEDPVFDSTANRPLTIRSGPAPKLDSGYVHAPYAPYRGPPEPSVVDRIAVIDDPDGDLAKRIDAYDKWAAAGGTMPFLDPSDFTLRKGLRTRYARRVVS